MSDRKKLEQIKKLLEEYRDHLTILEANRYANRINQQVGYTGSFNSNREIPNSKYSNGSSYAVHINGSLQVANSLLLRVGELIKWDTLPANKRNYGHMRDSLQTGINKLMEREVLPSEMPFLERLKSAIQSFLGIGFYGSTKEKFRANVSAVSDLNSSVRSASDDAKPERLTATSTSDDSDDSEEENPSLSRTRTPG